MATSKKKSAIASASRKSGLHKIRLVLDVLNTAPAAALALLTPSQREWAYEAQKTGTTTRLVLVFPDSLHRDLDEAIRALPGALAGSVIHASKV